VCRCPNSELWASKSAQTTGWRCGIYKTIVRSFGVLYFLTITLKYNETKTPEITKYQQGTPSWLDLATTDLDGAEKLYGQLFAVLQDTRGAVFQVIAYSSFGIECFHRPIPGRYVSQAAPRSGEAGTVYSVRLSRKQSSPESRKYTLGVFTMPLAMFVNHGSGRTICQDADPVAGYRLSNPVRPDIVANIEWVILSSKASPPIFSR